jgi:hypothetical protein
MTATRQGPVLALQSTTSSFCTNHRTNLNLPTPVQTTERAYLGLSLHSRLPYAIDTSVSLRTSDDTRPVCNVSVIAAAPSNKTDDAVTRVCRRQTKLNNLFTPKAKSERRRRVLQRARGAFCTAPDRSFPLALPSRSVRSTAVLICELFREPLLSSW